MLVVDDDADLRRSLERGLRLSGFAVRTAGGGADALAMTHDLMPDVVVLDIEMPGLGGLGFITSLREVGVDVPICVLSAHTSVSDRVEGLELGADDYLAKPFSLRELNARLHSLLRRRGRAWTALPDVLPVSPLQIEPSSRRVLLAGRDVTLTRREFGVLSLLVAHRGVVVPREQLLEAVWGDDFPTTSNVVDVVIGHVRRKFAVVGYPHLIHTVRGVGFVLRG
ncbi:response regulator transcription factor [Nocardia sp. NPDC057663]|uniref:response regulator transcription factor n=1 Tax=Nocardia sp. NPDC057663 TaxID=3346201 RepID=UPI00366E4930